VKGEKMKVGDVVKLKSGGVHMVVEAIQTWSKHITVNLKWFNGGEMHSASQIDVKALELAPDDAG
jgi:uncharacterized protein YodC (DUF2158 family)